jgi:hypothetical protein
MRHKVAKERLASGSSGGYDERGLLRHGGLL